MTNMMIMWMTMIMWLMMTNMMIMRMTMIMWMMMMMMLMMIPPCRQLDLDRQQFEQLKAQTPVASPIEQRSASPMLPEKIKKDKKKGGLFG